MPFTGSGWGYNVEYTPSEGPIETLSGGTEEVMPVWSEGREARLALAEGTYTNNSSFDIPPAFLSTGWAIGRERSEERLGFFVEGQSAGPNGGSIAGTLFVYYNNEVSSGSDVEGLFGVSAPPVDTVVEGASGGSGGGQYDLEFQPEGNGIGKRVNDVAYPNPDFFDVRYGYISGVITDVNGNIVGNEPVSADGSIFRANSSGEYEILAPGGVTVELESLGLSTTKQVTAASSDTVNLDFQFAGVEVTLRGPDGDVLAGVPVVLNITGETRQTDKEGKVSFTEVPPVDGGKVLLLNALVRDLPELSEGFTGTLDESLGVKLEGTVKDPAGNPIASTDVRIREPNGTTYTGGSQQGGQYSAAAPEVGALQLIIAEDDRRYATYEEVYRITDSESITNNVELEVRENIGTMG